jgi:hypothetical protein
VAEHQHVGLLRDGGRADRLHLLARHVQRHRLLGTHADAPADRQPHVRDHRVRARRGHRRRLLRREHVDDREQPELVRRGDHLHLAGEAQVGRLELTPDPAVEEAHRREVVHAREAGLAHLPQEPAHDPRRVGAVDPRDHGCALDDGQDLALAHLHYDRVRVAEREQPAHRAVPGHPEAARVVDDHEIGAAALDELRGDPRARPRAHDRLLSVDLALQATNDLLPGELHPAPLPNFVDTQRKYTDDAS